MAPLSDTQRTGISCKHGSEWGSAAILLRGCGHQRPVLFLQRALVMLPRILDVAFMAVFSPFEAYALLVQQHTHGICRSTETPEHVLAESISILRNNCAAAQYLRRTVRANFNAE
jgi:hypothetical protein